MVHLVGIPGSLRAGSYNRALLQAAAERLPEGATLAVHGLNGIPLYDGDEETAAGIPEAVQVLKTAIAAADGLVLATPEYNGGLPGVFKNAMDWLSRPASDIPKLLKGRPVALMGATPGRTGTANAQNAWLPVLRSLRMALWVEGGPFAVPGAGEVFDEAGVLVDGALEERLRSYLAGFVAHVAAGD